MHPGLPENASVSLQLAISKDENMADAIVLPLENGAVSSDDMEKAIVKFYNITPEVVKPWMGIIAYANIGSQQSRLGGEGFYYLKQQVNVLPVDAKLDIENTYFLGGTLSQKMEHSDLHAYVWIITSSLSLKSPPQRLRLDSSGVLFPEA